MRTRVRWSVSLFLVPALCVALSTPALPAIAAAPPSGSPGLRLGRTVSGEDAIRVLGPDLARVAAAHGQTAARLARTLRSDKRLFVDPSGALLYREAPVGMAIGAPVPASPSGAGAAASPADAFALHSKPDARRVIYLDFDGHVLSGTAWNTNENGGADIIAPAWDTEGGPAVFTDAERTAISRIWARVAEDYAPFDVDVTTAFPGEDRMTRNSTSDEYFGVRALVSPISSYLGPYGGIAYVGVFDYTSDAYKPALVFPENLANNEKYIAEACSHEVGHTLGLSHDGTTAGDSYYSGHGSGEIGWAPIMGSGYLRNVTQWSRGEYAGANNTEDDLAIIQSNGLAYRPDDHANTAVGATQIVATPSFAASGVIGGGDTDVLSITVGAGQFTAQAAPVSRGPNLDIAFEVRASDGTLVASAQPSTALAASVDAVLAAGTYTLLLRGMGTGNPTTGYSDYAVSGAWALSGTAVPGDATPPVAPVAAFTTSVTEGTAPLAVAFDGGASSDPDGSIASYAWSFGDGASGSGVTASHAYAVAGTYTAMLTVTDDRGATGWVSTQIVVSPAAAGTMRVTAITMTLRAIRTDRYARARVFVVDSDGRPIAGVTVGGSWTGLVAGTSTGTTGADGSVLLSSKRTRKSGTITLSVTSVARSGYTYTPTENVVTSGTLSLTSKTR